MRGETYHVGYCISDRLYSTGNLADICGSLWLEIKSGVTGVVPGKRIGINFVNGAIGILPHRKKINVNR